MKYLIKQTYNDGRFIEFEVSEKNNNWIVDGSFDVDESTKEEVDVYVGTVLAGGRYKHDDYKFEIVKEL